MPSAFNKRSKGRLDQSIKTMALDDRYHLQSIFNSGHNVFRILAKRSS